MTRLIALSAVLATASIAHADAPGDTPPEPLAPLPHLVEHTSQYGYQVALVDGAIVGGTAALMLASRDPAAATLLAMVAVSAYLFTGPIIHLRHGEHGNALKSLALRVGLPVIATGVASALSPSSTCTPTCTTHSGDLIGAAIGLVAATTIDATLNSTQTERTFAPAVGYSAGVVTLGVGGVF